jgi:hypothetical protein
MFLYIIRGDCQSRSNIRVASVYLMYLSLMMYLTEEITEAWVVTANNLSLLLFHMLKIVNSRPRFPPEGT